MFKFFMISISMFVISCAPTRTYSVVGVGVRQVQEALMRKAAEDGCKSTKMEISNHGGKGPYVGTAVCLD